MRWATRRHCHVDRAACAWLIRRFLDPDAEFVFVADPVCWTEVPSTWSAVSRQRKRWSQGLGELLRGARDMMLRPRYGTLGMVTLPYFWLFEQWGAPLVMVAMAVAALAGALGLIPWPENCNLVSVLRDGQVYSPSSDQPLEAGDELLFVASPEAEPELTSLLNPGR